MAPASPDDADRRARGAWATPPALVHHVLDRALEPVLAARSTPDDLVVVDPACGDGRFLVAAAERIARRFGMGRARAAQCCVGIELDPATADVARAALDGRATIIVGDALAGAWAEGAWAEGAWTESVDVVVGNPPFLTPLRRRTQGARRAGAPYADAATAFWRMAVARVRPDGGRVGLVLPASVLAARDAAPARAEVLRGARLAALWWAGTTMFDAQVDTCAVTVVRGEAQGAVDRWHGPGFARLVPAPISAGGLEARPTWGHLVAEAAGIPCVHLDGGDGTIGDRATVTADFRDQYYGLIEADAVHDDDDGGGPAGPPLVTSGVIDPGRCRWGERPVTFGRRRYRAPRVDVDALAPALQRWAARRLVPKVLVATQTRIIEAAVDEHGAWLPSVPVISVMPHRRDDLWHLGAVLCAPPVSAWAATTYLGAGLSGSALKLSARQVAGLPLPSCRSAWDEAALALERGDILSCARAMGAAYEVVDDAVLRWWCSYLVPADSPPVPRR